MSDQRTCKHCGQPIPEDNDGEEVLRKRSANDPPRSRGQVAFDPPPKGIVNQAGVSKLLDSVDDKPIQKAFSDSPHVELHDPNNPNEARRTTKSTWGSAAKAAGYGGNVGAFRGELTRGGKIDHPEIPGAHFRLPSSGAPVKMAAAGKGPGYMSVADVVGGIKHAPRRPVGPDEVDLGAHSSDPFHGPSSVALGDSPGELYGHRDHVDSQAKTVARNARGRTNYPYKGKPAPRGKKAVEN